jgi:hypothetical protein
MKKAYILALFWAFPLSSSIGWQNTFLPRPSNTSPIFKYYGETATTPAQKVENVLALFESMFPNPTAITFLTESLQYVENDKEPTIEEGKNFTALFDTSHHGNEMTILINKAKNWAAQQRKITLETLENREERLTALGAFNGALITRFPHLAQIATARGVIEGPPTIVDDEEAAAARQQDAQTLETQKNLVAEMKAHDSSETGWLSSLSLRNLCTIL